MPNRLAGESSPYLLQHKDNPVDWYPWGEEPLNRAQQENKPILLSIGYSACHWCHVMAHESFENPEIARLMNEKFVNIKVDREERPDLDQIYQNVAQAITHGGGWPLTVFLTPLLKPFFGGTYFPPDDRYGRPGFPRVLKALADAYEKENEAVTENARRLTDFIEKAEKQAVPPDAVTETRLPTEADLTAAVGELLSYMDAENGGFGSEPKFPNPTALAFLWRVGGLLGEGEAEASRAAVLQALRKMARGGIYDQLGGGFHRYSVDAHWSVPHFEKMLYDNGQLLKLYSEAMLDPRVKLQAEDRSLFAGVLRETVEYLMREMRSPEGAFYAAQDADSEGEEGKYFVWDSDDLEKAGLSRDEAKAFAEAFGITPEGNFEGGKTVLYRAQNEIAAHVDSLRAKLLAVRARRVPPMTDTKILLSWNALAISGLAWAAQALSRDGDAGRAAGEKAREAARGCYTFIRQKMTREGKRLFASFQGGGAKGNAFLDDYAFLALAALDLARFEEDAQRISELLGDAAGLLDAVQSHFRDTHGAGYFFTSDDHETLILRPKNLHDQAIPSGTAVTVHCLAAFSEIDWNGGGQEYYAEAERHLSELFPTLAQNPFSASELFTASALFLRGAVVVSGPGAAQAATHAFVFQKAPAASQRDQLVVCHQKACSAPHGDTDAFQSDVLSKLAQG